MAVALLATGVFSGRAAAGASDNRTTQAPGTGEYASSRIVVRFAPGLVDKPAVASHTGAAAVTATAPHELQQTPPARAGAALRAAWAQWGVIGMRSVAGHALARGDLAAQYGLDRTYVLEVPEETDTAAMVAAIGALTDDIESAEVDGIGTIAQFIPNDGLFFRQWGLHNTGQAPHYGTPDADIDAPEAWMLHTGDLGSVIVAIVDTGVDPHNELIGRIIEGTNTTSQPFDGTQDDCGHGTHVAGIVAAAGNNANGIAGVTWGAYIMPIRVFDYCSGYETDAAEGIIWAADHGADIINVSLQFPTGGTTFENAVDYAYESGVLVISAAGNNNFCGLDGRVCAPARFANCMAISGTNDRDELATSYNAGWNSNYGPEIDVCAPGDDIYSLVSIAGYSDMSGTSMASPMVAGLAALAKSFVPTLTHEDLWSLLSTTAEDLGPDGWDEEYGHGRINAYQALLNAGPVRIIASAPPDSAIDARQPSEPDGSNPAGWSSVDLIFGGPVTDITGLLGATFTVTQEGGEGPPPNVASVTVVEGEERTVRITLDRPITPGTWTTVAHADSGTSVRLGYLPADVNADGTSAPADILAIVDVLNGVTTAPVWSTDVDRSGETLPADVLRVIDLLNGAAAYDSYLNAVLP
jgi:hypothetical protein